MSASGLAERSAAPGSAGAPRRRPAAAFAHALRARAGLIFGAVVFALALYALHHLLAQFQYREVMDHLGALSWGAIAGALVLTALSYLTLAGYDLSALHYVGARLPIRTVLYASFTGYAISNNLGFALLSGGSVRYRVYSAAGLPGGDVARVIVFCGVTFTLGICAVGAVGFLLQPDAVARLLYLPPLAAQAIAALLIVALLGTLVLPMLMPEGLRLGRWRLNLPSPGLVIVQVLISSVDILLTAGILFILLPPHDFGFGAFIGIYCAALLAGLISHVPGGVGVFESIMLLGLAGAVPASGVLGALLAYRAAYYLLPMIVATLLLAGGELAEHRGRAVRAFGLMGKVADRVAPTAMAMLVFAVGIVLLVFGAVPADYTRLLALSRVVPLPVIEVAHLLASLTGLALLLLARGLQRRLAAAWTATAMVLAAGIVLSLGRGLDYGAVAMLGLVLAMLLPCRATFGRHSALTELRFSRGWLLAVIGAVAASVWLTLFSYKHVEYANDLWWHFALSADAPRSLRAALGMVLAVAAVALTQLLRQPAPRPLAPARSDLDRAAAIVARNARADGNLALVGDKALLFSAAGDGFLMYGIQGTSWIALSDPVADRPVQAELVWQFCELCDRNGAHPAFYRVRAETLPLYLDVGLLPIALAEEAVVPLTGFEPGPALAAAERRAEADGLAVEMVPVGAAEALMPALAAVSEDWLRSSGSAEKRFAFGRFDPAYLARFGILVVRRGGQIVAFANLWEAAPGTAAGLDLMRHRADAPDYVGDLLLARLLSCARDRGYRRFELGAVSRQTPSGPAAIWRPAGAAGADARGGGGRLDLHRIRERFAPEWEPRYLVSAGGLAPVRVLGDVAALVGTPTADRS